MGIELWTESRDHKEYTTSGSGINTMNLKHQTSPTWWGPTSGAKSAKAS